jgi:threonine dehydrogenase-like Zn-dependent dehydrogenase
MIPRIFALIIFPYYIMINPFISKQKKEIPMKSVHVKQRGKVEFIEAPVPEAKPGWVRVRPLLIVLCGSDVHSVYHLSDDDYPQPPGVAGHEMVAVVDAVGSPRGPIQPGDLALVMVNGGAMAEYYLAPEADILPLPPGKSLEKLVLAQPLGTVLFAAKRLPNMVDQSAVVIGQGAIGLFFNTVLRRLGARQVIGLDLLPERAALGARFGATHTYCTGDQDALHLVHSCTDGRLGDLVVEAAGEVESIQLAHSLVRDSGHILFFGVPRQHGLIPFDFFEWFRKHTHTQSISDAGFEPGRASMRLALEWVASGQVDVSTMITHRLPFERVTEGYELVRTRRDGALKVLIEMPAWKDRKWE